MKSKEEQNAGRPPKQGDGVNSRTEANHISHLGNEGEIREREVGVASGQELAKAVQEKDETIAQLRRELSIYQTIQVNKENIFAEIKRSIEETLKKKLEQDLKNKEEIVKENQKRELQMVKIQLKQKQTQTQGLKKIVQALESQLSTEKTQSCNQEKELKQKIDILQNQLNNLTAYYQSQFNTAKELLVKNYESSLKKTIEQKVGQLGKQISSLKGNIEERVRSEGRLIRERDNAISKCDQLTIQLNETSKKINALNQQSQSLQKKVQQSNSKCKILDSKRKTLEQKLISKEDQENSYRYQMDNKLKKLENSWKANVQKLKEENNTQIKLCQSKLKDQIDSKNRQLESVRSQRKKRESDDEFTIQKLRSQKSQLQKHTNDLKSQLQKLNSICSSIQQMKCLKKNGKVSFDGLPAYLSSLFADNEQTFEKISFERNELKKEKDEVTKQAEELKKWMEQESINIKNFLKVSNQKREEKKKLNQLFVTFTNILTNTAQALDFKDTELSNEKKKSGDVMHQMESWKAQADVQKKECESLRKQLNILKINIVRYEMELDAIKLKHAAEINANQTKIEGLEINIKQIQSSLKFSQQENVSLKSDLNQAKAWKPKFDDAIKENESLKKQAEELREKMLNSNQKVALLQEQLKTQLIQKQNAEKEIKKNKEEKETMKKEFSQKEKVLKDDFQRKMTEGAQKVNNAVQQATGSSAQSSDFTIIAQFIKDNLSNSRGAFTVCEILEFLPKEKAYLQAECRQFLGCSNLSSKLSFKYDQSNKNFQPYLPDSTKQFPFLILFKTKAKQSMFAVVGTALGKEGKATALNLTGMKVMKKNERTRTDACGYVNSTLKFGNQEITIRNNWNLEVKVNTSIIGDKYFLFTREELLGAGENSPVQLEAFEIHRLYPTI